MVIEMINGMALKYRVSLAIIAVLFAICMLLGSSYALWQITEIQDTENVITSGCFEIEFTEGENSKINLDNQYPISDQKGLKLKPYTFTITNKCTVKANYTVYLNVMKITTNEKTNIMGSIPDSNIKYSLKKVGASGTVANSLISEKTTNPDTSAFQDHNNISKSYILDEGVLNGATATEDGSITADGGSVTYELRLWIDEKATTTINNHRFEAQVATIARATNYQSQS